ncbi:unnamed protein product [Clonostachys byssicola]|uniref:Uncharacterized protein n=1 Tax=Clonostachys byssicola TaxID=160290 RepID=A0A9N9U2V0_9HYPO|nr:unnamed protein product [Clonostachys byssicola]
MSSEGWQITVFDALAPQTEKVVKIFEMGLGWELWAQAELGIQRISEKTENDEQEDRSWRTECSRERKVYAGTNQRCDFLTSYKLLSDYQPSKYLREFLELKCLIRGDFRGFQTKVRNMAILSEWERDSEYVCGTVLAITVHIVGEEDIFVDEMKNLALNNGIQWQFKNEPTHIGDYIGDHRVSRILAWVWTRNVYASEA